MGIDINSILSLEGNKYENTFAIIKYAKKISQEYNDSLEVNLPNNQHEKITTVAINDFFTKKYSYSLEQDSKKK